jgi:predicted DCC family thiol-disulfide oxidoreductase YuxK
MIHDCKHVVQFASAQSELGSAIYEALGIPVDDSYLLIDELGVHSKSDGYIRLAKILGGWWRIAAVARIVPRNLRDWLYDIVARNRYRWFGRTDQCRLLTHEQRSKLVVDDQALWVQLKALR